MKERAPKITATVYSDFITKTITINTSDEIHCAKIPFLANCCPLLAKFMGILAGDGPSQNTYLNEGARSILI